MPEVVIQNLDYSMHTSREFGWAFLCVEQNGTWRVFDCEFQGEPYTNSDAPPISRPGRYGHVGWVSGRGTLFDLRSGLWETSVRWFHLRLPSWLVLCVLLIPGVFMVRPAAKRFLRWDRYPPGHCRVCGYDLRATPDRCPECGTVPETKLQMNADARG